MIVRARRWLAAVTALSTVVVGSTAAIAGTGSARRTIEASAPAKAKVPGGIAEVGTPKRAVRRNVQHLLVPVPTRVANGDLLVTAIAAHAGSAAGVHCPTSWTVSTDVVHGATRLITCWWVSTGRRKSVAVTFSRRLSASALTVAFRGEKAADPVVSSSARPSRSVLAPAYRSAGDLELLAAAGRPHSGVISLPAHAAKLALLRQHQATTIGLAIHSLASSSSGGGRWRGPGIQSVTNSTLLLRPASAAADRATIRVVGPSATGRSSRTTSISTGFPAGASAGDLVVSWIETTAASAVTCPSGWHRALNSRNGSLERLVACWSGYAPSKPPTAALAPAAGVSMVTSSFGNVASGAPVDSAVAVVGSRSPAVQTSIPGEALVESEGSATGGALAAGRGLYLLGATADGRRSQLAVGATTFTQAGTSPSYRWSATPAFEQPPLSGVLSLIPARLPQGGGSSPTPTPTPTSSPPPVDSPPTPPTAPPATVCGDTDLLSGPITAPAGAVTISPEQSVESVVDAAPAGTTFWFEPGTYTLGSGEFDQIVPDDGDTFVGAPGAIINGQNLNDYAFVGDATNVTIEYLTVENFGPTGGNQDQGVVNHDSAAGWTIEYSTITDNAGAGTMVGSNNVLRYNCLQDNGQYGFNAYSTDGPSNIVLDHNEIAGNDTYDFEEHDPGCGCTGGGKFWVVDGASVTDNYVHDNDGVGLWADTNNRGFDIEGNYISGNAAEGVIYEISYNALIQANTFVRNGFVEGIADPGFPTAALYLSESGADSRVDSAYNQTLAVQNNVFTDNWGGVTLWENADRFCNSPDNSSSGDCTLVNPSEANLGTCVTGTINDPPYYSDCRWKTQNVLVSGNTFSFDPADIGDDCTPANSCGFNALISNYGTDPSWSPYQGEVVEQAITFDQNNLFQDNTYTGPWSFMAHDQGTVLTLAQWQAAPYNQD
jgi:hypothetical protein